MFTITSFKEKLAFLKLKKVWIPIIVFIEVCFFIYDIKSNPVLLIILFIHNSIIILFILTIPIILRFLLIIINKLPFLRLKKVWIPIILYADWVFIFIYDLNLNFILYLLLWNSIFIVVILLFTRFTFLRLKKVWIPLVITLWIVSFYWMNYYEHKNGCRLLLARNFPFMQCSMYFDFWDWILKPLILLYPTSDTPVDVSLEYSPWFSATYPEYNTIKKWWSVLAHPDGTLVDNSTHQDTYGLFWEGNPALNNYDLSKGFIVKGSELRNFLYTKLTDIGLNTKEKSDFIMYWYPKLQEYPYIQITFAGSDYTNTAKLNIFPTPDSLLRVFMIAKPLTEYREIPEQKLSKFERKWFSVIEWGGTIVQ